MAKKKLWQFDRSFYLCPLCGAKVNWMCYGKTGHAECSRSLHATQLFTVDDNKKFCTWRGKVTRRANGRIDITYEDGES